LSIYKIKNIKRINSKRNYSSYLSFKYPDFKSNSKNDIVKEEINTLIVNANSKRKRSVFCKICGEIIGSAGINHTCDIIHT